MGEWHGSIVTMGALSVLVGGVWYFKEEPSGMYEMNLPQLSCPTLLLCHVMDHALSLFPLVIAARKPIHHHGEALEEESMEEKVMKRWFEEWMTEYGCTYKDKEEKAMRYEVFKHTAQFVNQHNTKGSGCTVGTNNFADQTEDESRCYGGCHPAHMRKEKELVLIQRCEEEELMRIRRGIIDY